MPRSKPPGRRYNRVAERFSQMLSREVAFFFASDHGRTMTLLPRAVLDMDLYRLQKTKAGESSPQRLAPLEVANSKGLSELRNWR